MMCKVAKIYSDTVRPFAELCPSPVSVASPRTAAASPTWPLLSSSPIRRCSSRGPRSWRPLGWRPRLWPPDAWQTPRGNAAPTGSSQTPTGSPAERGMADNEGTAGHVPEKQCCCRCQDPSPLSQDRLMDPCTTTKREKNYVNRPEPRRVLGPAFAPFV